MRSRSWLIFALFVLGILLTMAVKGVILPRMELNAQQYKVEQQNPLTHDPAILQKYRSKYMGDFSNLSNLFNALPLSRTGMTFQLNSEALTAEILYKGNTEVLGAEQVERSLLYNATAAFALIDNLEGLTFSFENKSYQVKRSAMKLWYGTGLSGLLEEEMWRTKVQHRLGDHAYSARFAQTVLTTE
ncbi:DUF4825 domain-containing protein [Paenibacillus filicis]